MSPLSVEDDDDESTMAGSRVAALSCKRDGLEEGNCRWNAWLNDRDVATSQKNDDDDDPTIVQELLLLLLFVFFRPCVSLNLYRIIGRNDDVVKDVCAS